MDSPASFAKRIRPRRRACAMQSYDRRRIRQLCGRLHRRLTRTLRTIPQWIGAGTTTTMIRSNKGTTKAFAKLFWAGLLLATCGEIVRAQSLPESGHKMVLRAVFRPGETLRYELEAAGS